MARQHLSNIKNSRFSVEDASEQTTKRSLRTLRFEKVQKYHMARQHLPNIKNSRFSVEDASEQTTKRSLRTLRFEKVQSMI